VFSDLADPLGPEIIIDCVLEIKGQVLHYVHLHVKVPGWLSDLNPLLTKKLPKFLLRLKEMSGHCGEFLRMTFFIARFCGW